MEVRYEVLDRLNGVDWCVPLERFCKEDANTEPEITTFSPVGMTKAKPSVSEIASKKGWKVGKKEVRVIGHGELTNHPEKVNGWEVMKATDYPGIVPQEALDRVEILLDEGVEIKGLLIADDLRRKKLKQIRQLVFRPIERVRAIEWRKVRAETVRGVKTLASTSSAIATPIVSGAKRKAQEINWKEAKDETVRGIKTLASTGSAIATPIIDGLKRTAKEINWKEVGVVFGKCLKVMAIATAAVVGAVAILPLLALVAIPAGLLTLDPWLIVVDSENRWWVVAEWWD